MEILGIQVEIVKKKIKNMHLSVLPPEGRVRVSAPMNLSDKNISMFVRTKITWIKKQQEKFSNQPRQSERKFESGETLYVFGKQYYLQVDYSNKRKSLILDGNKAILNLGKKTTIQQKENFVNEWYRSILKKEIEKYLPKWEAKTNLFSKSWQTKNMTTKWGTCNTITKKIWFNLQLAKKPIECLEYIILHELAHLKVKNHSKDFIAIMDKYMPYWRNTKKILNESKLEHWKE